MSENKNSLKQLMLELMLIREKYSEAQIMALHDTLSNIEISKKGNYVFKILQLLQGLETNLDTKSIPKNSATKETVTGKEAKKKSSKVTTEKEKKTTKNLKKIISDLKIENPEKHQKILRMEEILKDKKNISLQEIREYTHRIGILVTKKDKRDPLVRQILLKLATLDVNEFDLLTGDDPLNQKNQLEVLSEAIMDSRKSE